MASYSVESGTQHEPGTSGPSCSWKPSRVLALQPGDAGAYRLIRHLDGGGFGEIWEAEQVSLRRLVALKRISPELYGPSRPDRHRAATRVFRCEALITAYLDHPNIPSVHDIVVDAAGQLLMVMQLVRGSDWATRMKQERHAQDFDDFLHRQVRVLRTVAQTVAHAHARGIIHRDLKPAQVMIDEFDETYLMDWGLAATFGPSDLRPDLLLANGEPVPSTHEIADLAGTPCYMAPEQTLTPGDQLGPWTDVYLLGGILYEILTDHPPHPHKTIIEAVAKAATSVIVPPERLAPRTDFPSSLAELAMTALSRKPCDRIPSAMAFARELDAHISGESSRAESRRLVRTTRRTMATGECTYELLFECDANLERALTLWPANKAAKRLRQELSEHGVRAAIQRGDCGLARFLVGRIDNARLRVELLDQIRAAQGRD